MRTAVPLLVVAGIVFIAGTAAAQVEFTEGAYGHSTVFSDYTTYGSYRVAGLAFDGSHYYRVSENSVTQIRPDGARVRSWFVPMHMSSVFTDASGNLYGYGHDRRIYRIDKVSPGIISVHRPLSGGPTVTDLGVVLNGAGTEYVAHYHNTVLRWDALSGNFLGQIPLLGYGSQGDYSTYSGFRMAVAGDYFLTFANSRLSAWNLLGQRVDTALLLGLPAHPTVDYSLSFANGKAFVLNAPYGHWRGYDIAFVDRSLPGTVTPEPLSLVLIGTGLLGVASLRLRRRRKEEHLA